MVHSAYSGASAHELAPIAIWQAALGFIGDECTTALEAANSLLMSMYEEMGTQLALQYAGSQALNPSYLMTQLVNHVCGDGHAARAAARRISGADSHTHALTYLRMLRRLNHVRRSTRPTRTPRATSSSR